MVPYMSLIASCITPLFFSLCSLILHLVFHFSFDALIPCFPRTLPDMTLLQHVFYLYFSSSIKFYNRIWCFILPLTAQFHVFLVFYFTLVIICLLYQLFPSTLSFLFPHHNLSFLLFNHHLSFHLSSCSSSASSMTTSLPSPQHPRPPSSSSFFSSPLQVGGTDTADGEIFPSVLPGDKEPIRGGRLYLAASRGVPGEI